MIYVGNQTSCFTATPEEPFIYALANGFSAFEWFPDKKPGAGWDESDLTPAARKSIREAAETNRVRLSVHARWQANLLIPECLPLVWKDAELARELGAVLLNVHLFHEQGLATFVEALVPLIRRTGEAGLKLAIENTPHHAPEQFNELFERLRSLKGIDAAHVGMCLDPGHANLCAATRNDFLGFVDRLAPEVPIIHLHLHENWGDADTHLALFTGPSSRDDSGIRALLQRLRQRNFSGAAIFEQWPQPPAILNSARDRLIRLWNSSPEESPSMSPAYKGGLGEGRPARSKRRVFSPQLSPPEEKRESARSAPSRSDTENDAEDSLFARLIAGDRDARSWREKLDVIRNLLAGDDSRLTADTLRDIAIYLRFLATGEVPCSEDGRHFRPGHHAKIASQIQQRLARLTTPDNTFIVRRISPFLPSSSQKFQRPEPLTRIRDIAHRNDIDSDLKREIKTTLQNKLHRCAGPEDLATSAALLERITAPGANYSPAFVEQFKIFHEELKEFFNARSLDEHLTELLPSADDTRRDLIQKMLRQKTADTLAGKRAALGTLTTLRGNFGRQLAAQPGSEMQNLLLADIALEDLVFVLLSEIINATDNSSPAEACETQVEALTLGVENLALSGVQPEESRAVESELRAWGNFTPATSRDDLLRVKATLQRCRRLAEDFSSRIVELFSGRAAKLGRALGVAEHALRLFAESDIRSHNVFQVSKLTASLLRQIRKHLQLAAWDVLVPGKVIARLKQVNTLEELADGNTEPVLVLLKSATGDEEIPRKVAGVILAHEMPHLSHLAVRARQSGVVFVACEAAQDFERLCSHQNEILSFEASPDTVFWGKTNDQNPPSGGPTVKPQKPEPSASHSRSFASIRGLTSTPTLTETPWIPLEQAVPDRVGNKAASARRLAELSHRPEAGFSTPGGFVIPFGVMEAQLRAEPELESEYQQLVRKLKDLPRSECETATQRLQEIVRKLSVPEAIIASIRGSTLLVVRSSANFEDLEDFAGAGLYESVLNVRPPEIATAIRTVWSSLWTSRAVLSRQAAGIAHDYAHMAVLIQEMLAPDFSFILHTVNPIKHSEREVYAEIVVGLGETLASGATRGSPWRLVCDKENGAVTVQAFANFSQALRPQTEPGKAGPLREMVDYSQVELSRDVRAREHLGKRLAKVGVFVEKALQGPQDIEGAVVGDKIYLVQTRPQQGLSPNSKTG